MRVRVSLIGGLSVSYTRHNFKTKKALKEAVAAAKADTTNESLKRDIQLERGFIDTPTDGVAFIEGPHYPQPHTWYAKVQVEGGVVTRVLS